MGGLVEQPARRGDRRGRQPRHRARGQRSSRTTTGSTSSRSEIDNLAIRLLATRAADGASICAVIAMALKISNDLERICDYAANVAKRVDRARQGRRRCSRSHAIPRMAQICRRRWSRTCSTPMSSATRRQAIAVWHRDDEVDEMYNSLFRELLDLHARGPAQHHGLRSICCSSPRTSSGSATTPPTSPRRSTTWSTASGSIACPSRRPAPAPRLTPRHAARAP